MAWQRLGIRESEQTRPFGETQTCKHNCSCAPTALPKSSRTNEWMWKNKKMGHAQKQMFVFNTTGKLLQGLQEKLINWKKSREVQTKDWPIHLNNDSDRTPAELFWTGWRHRSLTPEWSLIQGSHLCRAVDLHRWDLHSVLPNCPWARQKKRYLSLSHLTSLSHQVQNQFPTLDPTLTQPASQAPPEPDPDA